MKQKANEGLSKVYWISVVTVLVMVVLGAILWWYDAYLVHEAQEHTTGYSDAVGTSANKQPDFY